MEKVKGYLNKAEVEVVGCGGPGQEDLNPRRRAAGTTLCPSLCFVYTHTLLLSFTHTHLVTVFILTSSLWAGACV